MFSCQPSRSKQCGQRTINMPHFNRYLGIDYSGAETADSSCKGIRVYSAEGSAAPEPVLPPPSPRRYWTRRGLAEWLCNELGGDTPPIVGIDHAFSFPLPCFEKYRLSGNWQDFLVDFQHHWPTGAQHMHVYQRFCRCKLIEQYAIRQVAP